MSAPKKRTPRWQAGRSGVTKTHSMGGKTNQNPNKTVRIWMVEAYEAACLGRRGSIASKELLRKAST